MALFSQFGRTGKTVEEIARNFHISLDVSIFNTYKECFSSTYGSVALLASKSVEPLFEDWAFAYELEKYHVRVVVAHEFSLSHDTTSTRLYTCGKTADIETNNIVAALDIPEQEVITQSYTDSRFPWQNYMKETNMNVAIFWYKHGTKISEEARKRLYVIAAKSGVLILGFVA